MIIEIIPCLSDNYSYLIHEKKFNTILEIGAGSGRFSDVFVNGKKIGHIGEIDSSVLENFKIRTSVVGFEINLSGLIFD